MGWRDGFSAKGSFKGAEFYVRESDLEVGRRVQVHEYPQRDIPFAEDLGRKARKLNFEAYCIGADYHIARDALIAKAEEGGAGTLRHPYHGSLTVTVISFRVRESTSEGGYAAISIQCVEAGEQAFPAVIASTQVVVQRAADTSLADAINAFAAVFNLDAAGTAVDDFLGEVDDVFAAVANVTGAVTGPLADIIRAPAELGAAIAGAVTNISSIATEPLRALNIYRNLFDTGSDATVDIYSAPRAQQQARNTQALTDLVRASGVISACKASASLELSPALQGGTPVTRNQIAALRTELLDAIDARQQAAGDTLYSSLADLRVAVSADLSTRGSRLPEVVSYTPRATLPALVLAHRLYGDATRDAELVNINGIAHPGFVSGGQALEVLAT